MRANLLGKKYFYFKNIIGNIIKIIYINGTVMIEYSYGAWIDPESSISVGLVYYTIA